MPKLIKDGAIIDNTWQLVDAEIAQIDQLPEGQILVSLEFWQTNKSVLSDRGVEIGLSLTNTDDLSVITDDITRFPVIEIKFPAFMDGRGFSLGRLLRERYDFQGELRASGGIIRDQLCYLRRCGFDSFSFADDSIDLEQAKESLFDFTDAYQASVDQPLPLYMRR